VKSKAKKKFTRETHRRRAKSKKAGIAQEMGMRLKQTKPRRSDAVKKGTKKYRLSAHTARTVMSRTQKTFQKEKGKRKHPTQAAESKE